MLIIDSSYNSQNYTCLLNTFFHTDTLYMVEFGHSIPFPGTRVGPRVREQYLMHFLLQGSGYFDAVPIRAGNGFLICPNENHTFVTDQEGTWEHCWFGFHGTDVKRFLSAYGIAPTNHVFSFRNVSQLRQACKRLCYETKPTGISELTLQSLLYYAISLRQDVTQTQDRPLSRQDNYVNQAVTFMRNGYSEPLSIAELAKQINISQKYLWKIFTEKMGMSPQKYLLELRMDAAKRYLCSTDISISEVACSVGYTDVVTFIQNFKNNTSCTPSQYRKKFRAMEQEASGESYP